MESALRPREIQARVRAGESLDDVAAAAGVPLEKIEPFIAPVLAERAYIATQAQEAPVRRRGEHSSNRTLLSAITARLSARDVERGDVEWDAWKIEGRRWHVRADVDSEATERHATFVFDLDGRFSVPTNEDGHWLVSEDADAAPVTPRKRPGDPDTEPTLDLDDELALVRAVNVERYPYDDPNETGDAYSPGNLAEVDGVYDIVPPSSDMDVLYDMLASFNEDSVQIYRGLTTPVVADDEEGATETGASAPTIDTPVEDDPGDLTTTDESDSSATELPEPSDAADSAAGATPTTESREDQPAQGEELDSAGTPLTAARPDTEQHGDDEPVSEPVQPTLDTGEDVEEPIPEKKPRRKSRKRASVPSWDEIMFGSPTTPKNPR